MRYHVAVIGAGPAGSTAARHLAQSGLSVLLLEKALMPRVKPCGGALTHRALTLLPSGAESFLQEHPHSWTFQSRTAPAVTIARDQPYCHIVERQHFDRFLAQAARHAGAEVHEGEALTSLRIQDDRVHLVTTSGHYQADWVVAADGAPSLTAKLAGFPRPRQGAAIETEVAVSAHEFARYQGRVEIHLGQYPWGYAWVIPRAGILNLGVGSFRPNSFALKQEFYAFVEHIVGHRPIQALGHALPYRISFQPPVRDRILFVGDAAGYMDAFSAEGIYSALRSGLLAAQSIVEQKCQPTASAAYARRFHAEFWPSLKAAIKMSLLFYPLVGFWSDFFARNQTLLADYLDVASGHIPYQVLQRHTERALLAQPRLLLHQHLSDL
ncbi:MAG: geranylgeranyl reductase [Sulfobacillus acidophilus]|uniref:Geranylgeranyl reductase n=1 Tax=Sulfobacillus acidophilus TaxID=53633 RepID=A0A2T2WK59_9FIRM|nr:MAG: geranylgeranyl reductase [Sulfobacillus acidophilus]